MKTRAKREQELKSIFGSRTEIALYTSDPIETPEGSEARWPGYERKSLTGSFWNIELDGSTATVSLKKEVRWNPPKGMHRVTHLSIIDKSGVVSYVMEFNVPVEIGSEHGKNSIGLDLPAGTIKIVEA